MCEPLVPPMNSVCLPSEALVISVSGPEALTTTSACVSTVCFVRPSSIITPPDLVPTAFA